MTKEFVAEDFKVPIYLETDLFKLLVLRPEYTDIDYDAVMSSKTRLRSVFSKSSEWPRDEMTLEENRVDLIRHEKEFTTREAFAFSVLSIDGKQCLGCLYINPPKVREFDCEVYLWVRDENLDLDDALYATVKKWLHDDWPFEQIGFPGREIPWSEWESFKRNR